MKIFPSSSRSIRSPENQAYYDLSDFPLKSRSVISSSNEITHLQRRSYIFFLLLGLSSIKSCPMISIHQNTKIVISFDTAYDLFSFEFCFSIARAYASFLRVPTVLSFIVFHCYTSLLLFVYLGKERNNNKDRINLF